MHYFLRRMITGLLMSSFATPDVYMAVLRAENGRVMSPVEERSAMSINSPGEEKEFIRRAVGGDREAFRVIVDKFKSRLFSVAYDMLRSREDAEDVVQEAFVKAYFSLNNFRQDSSILTWLYRIVYNLCIDEKRRRSRRGGSPEEFDESMGHERMEVHLDSVPGPQEALLRKERAGRINLLMGKLTEEHRQVIMLREVDGLSYEEIAEALRISRGTVMSRLHYARKKLQEGLKDYAPSARQGRPGVSEGEDGR